ncbi:hypothetical protein OG921_04355 [Aldersonia sp. NBC_00410]|uniref:hypothetical protein n=1 Tax=Aldersonia sp. NBC_00410 TaxID=2975954 RepID=UPI0022512694|nr:hypothetical protein [Aldersonia sp. NBC_00410]MCX5042412.1 hypothetical protein [Aldersonia sp. NBC_00410]
MGTLGHGSGLVGDAARLRRELARSQKAADPHRRQLQRDAGTRSDYLRRALLDVAIGDARAHDASHYALAILSQSYRRGYSIAGARLTQVAETAREGELFEQMCVLGRECRAARDRLDAATTALT